MNMVYVCAFILNKICSIDPELLLLSANHDLFVKIMSYQTKAIYEIAPSLNCIFLRSTLYSSVWNIYIPTTYSVIFICYFTVWDVGSSFSKWITVLHFIIEYSCPLKLCTLEDTGSCQDSYTRYSVIIFLGLYKKDSEIVA
jgi:hypothetical protein